MEEARPSCSSHVWVIIQLQLQNQEAWKILPKRSLQPSTRGNFRVSKTVVPAGGDYGGSPVFVSKYKHTGFSDLHLLGLAADVCLIRWGHHTHGTCQWV